MMMANMAMPIQNIGNQIQFMGNQRVGIGMQLQNACFGMQNLDELIQNMTIQIFHNYFRGCDFLNLVTDYGTTIDQLLKNYMNRIGRSELINSKNIGITLNGEKKLMFGDNTTVEKFFGSVQDVNVYVDRLE